MYYENSIFTNKWKKLEMRTCVVPKKSLCTAKIALLRESMNLLKTQLKQYPFKGFISPKIFIEACEVDFVGAVNTISLTYLRVIGLDVFLGEVIKAWKRYHLTFEIGFRLEVRHLAPERPNIYIYIWICKKILSDVNHPDVEYWMYIFDSLYTARLPIRKLVSDPEPFIERTRHYIPWWGISELVPHPSDVLKKCLHTKKGIDDARKMYANLQPIRVECMEGGTYYSYVIARDLYIESYSLLSYALYETVDIYYSGDIPPWVVDLNKLKIVARKIAVCCYYLNQLDEAMEWAAKSIEIGLKINPNPLYLGRTYILMARVHINLRNYDMAVKILEEVYKSGGMGAREAVPEVAIELVRALCVGDMRGVPSKVARTDPSSVWRLWIWNREAHAEFAMKCEYVEEAFPDLLCTRVQFCGGHVKIYRCLTIIDT